MLKDHDIQIARELDLQFSYHYKRFFKHVIVFYKRLNFLNIKTDLQYKGN